MSRRSGAALAAVQATSLAAAAAAAVLVLFVLEALGAARIDAQTSDEAVTIASGYAFVRTGQVLLNAEHPMLAKAAIGAPLLLLDPELDRDTDAWRHHQEYVAAYELLWENRVPPGRLLLAARAPVVAAAGALLLLILAAAWRLYGPLPGLLALVTAATCPDLLGHGHLATLDVPLALATTVTLALFLSYARRPSRRRHLAFAVALGLTLATKISGLQVLPALAVAGLVRALVDPGLTARARIGVPAPLLSRPRLGALYLLLGGLVVAVGYAGLVLVATYLGSPRPYLVGLERNALLAGYGHPTYLLGAISTHGFPQYFLVALGVKLPLLVLALLAASLLTWPVLRRGHGSVELPALAFAVTWIALASAGPAQTGVRYVFPAYPVIFAFAARLFAARLGRPGLRAALAVVVAAASLGVAVGSRTTYLSYFNELVADPARGVGILADSNLDWGQDLGRLRGWLRAMGDPPLRLGLFSNAPPEAYGIVYQALPAAGPVLPPPATLLPAGQPDLLAVSANNLLGLFFDRDLYAWLRARQPVAIIGGSIWVYDLGRRREDHLALAGVYQQAGWRRWAAHERALAAARQ